MLPLVVFLLGAASLASASTKGELDWVLIVVDVEVLGCPEANSEVSVRDLCIGMFGAEKKSFGIIAEKRTLVAGRPDLDPFHKLVSRSHFAHRAT